MRNRGETTSLTGNRGAPPIFLGVPGLIVIGCIPKGKKTEPQKAEARA